jgi:hypothetical protein
MNGSSSSVGVETAAQHIIHTRLLDFLSQSPFILSMYHRFALWQVAG